MTAPNPPFGNDPTCQPPSEPANPSPTAELSALAAHLRRLADQITDLDTRYNQISDTLTATVLPRLDSIGEDTTAQLAEHTDAVQQLLDSLSAARPGEPPNWPTMNADQAATAWNQLADWIADTLVPWYEITRDQLPDCWALHRPALLHLNWLHHTYQAAHQPGAGPRATADWHTRWLPTALHAVREAIPRRGTRVCGPGHHLSSDAERARPAPSGQPGPAVPAPSPGTQLADRTFWQPFYDHAMATDLATRDVSAFVALSDRL
jgi:hypothetical protein